MRSWFSVQLKGEGEKKETVAELSIFDFIGDWIDDYWGFGVTAKSFLSQLSALPDSVGTIRVHINSPGGDVFSALAIANALRDQRTKGRTVETIVDGLAASAATLVTMAGAPARMSDNAVFMVHNPWTGAVGNAEELRKSADTLDKIREALVATYQWHTELSADDIIELLDAETWMDASEAQEWGFIDEVDEGLAVAASLDPRAVGKLSIPERFAAQVKAFLRSEDAPAIEPAPVVPEIPEEPKEPEAEPPADPSEVVAACASAGIDVKAVASLVASRPTMAQALAGIERMKAEREAAQERADHIRAACALAHLPELAEPMAGLGCDLPAARALLVTLRASLDKIELDSTLEPDHGAKRKPVIDTVAIYAERNGLRKLEK